MRRLSAAIVLSTFVATGCDFTVFDDIGAEAPVRVIEAPENYPGGRFGTLLGAEAGSASHFVIGGGEGTPVRVHPGIDGRSVLLDPALYDACTDPEDCGMGAGASVALVPTWGSGRDCVVVGAPQAGALKARCASTGAMYLNAPAASGIGASLAALPFGGSGFAAGILISGAPAAATGGAIYGVGMTQAEVVLDAAGVGATARLGTVLSAAERPDGSAMIAALAPGANRVVVAVLGQGDRRASMRACVDATAESAIALGNVLGDHELEVIVSDATGVAVYEGGGLPASEGCQAWGTAPMRLACPDGLGVQCEGSRFGAALLVASIHSEGPGGLFVGAPGAAVNGVAGAGAVFGFTQEGGQLVASELLLLTHSNPDANMNLGTSLAALSGASAVDEIIAGAPGANRVLVFMCVGIERESNHDPLCISSATM